MIYLDTSVLLAHLLAEDRSPGPELWNETLVASRLVEYEAWIRLRARGLEESHGDHLRSALDRVAFLDMAGPVLAGALTGPSTRLRTLDALHLASADFLRNQDAHVEMASYDERLLEGALAIGLPIAQLK